MSNPEVAEATAGSQKRVGVYGWVEQTIAERCLKGSAVVNAALKVASRNPDLLVKALLTRIRNPDDDQTCTKRISYYASLAVCQETKRLALLTKLGEEETVRLAVESYLHS